MRLLKPSAVNEKKKLKICMIGQKQIPSRAGGIEVVVEELATRLVQRGHSITCFNRSGAPDASDSADRKKRSVYRGIELRDVFTLNKKGIAAVTSSISATFHAAFGRFDIVHFHAEGPCAMIWLPKLFGKKCIVTIHGLDWQREKWKGSFGTNYIRLGEREAAKFADDIIVLSRNTQEYFRNVYGRETVFIPNGVTRPKRQEAKKITETFGLEKDSYILFIGRLVPEKGLRYLIEAYKDLHTDKKLVIAGSANDTQDFLIELKQRAAGDPRIIFTGFVSGRMLEELYSNAYVYCLPSDLEGMPLGLLEAMSYGNCCLVSDIPECLEIVNENAAVFQKGDFLDIRSKLQELCDSPTLVEEYRTKASSYIGGWCDWDYVADKTLEVYRSALDGTQPSKS